MQCNGPCPARLTRGGVIVGFIPRCLGSFIVRHHIPSNRSIPTAMGAGHARQDALHGRGWSPELREVVVLLLLMSAWAVPRPTASC